MRCFPRCASTGRKTRSSRSPRWSRTSASSTAGTTPWERRSSRSASLRARNISLRTGGRSASIRESEEEKSSVHATLPLLEVSDFPALRRERLETLQVNLGYECNQTCVHCHVNAGPTRTEQMDRKTVHAVLRYLEASGVGTLDITGGAPELNPHFRELVGGARALGAHVIDRCNLTVLEEPGQDDLADFLAGRGVEIVASLPCYTEELVDRQRGKGVYESSIRVLKRLNALGYGIEGSGL